MSSSPLFNRLIYQVSRLSAYSLLAICLGLLSGCGDKVPVEKNDYAGNVGAEYFDKMGCAGCHGRAPGQGAYPITEESLDNINANYIASTMPPRAEGEARKCAAPCSTETAKFLQSWFKGGSSSSTSSSSSSSSSSTSSSSSSSSSTSASSSSTSTSTSSASSTSSTSSTSSSSSSSSSSSGGDALVGKGQFEASCAGCHGNLGQGGTSNGLDPRLYTEADLTRIIPAVDATHASCNAANGCAANTAAYLISLAPRLDNGKTLFSTLGNGACVDCHGLTGLGGVNPKGASICSWENPDCVDNVQSFDYIKNKSAKMGVNGAKTPYLCTSQGSATCADDIALYLKALAWKRVAQ